MIEAPRGPVIDSALKNESKSEQVVSFGKDVKDLVLVPVRAELDNGNLFNFLTSHNQQRGLGTNKLGLIFLVNNTATDEANKDLIAENDKTATYLSAISTKDVATIDELDIPARYKTLAYDIIDKNQLEITSRTYRSPYDKAHFGDLRIRLFDLAGQYKHPSLPPDEVVVHLTDADTQLPPNHYRILRRHYKKYNKNISRYDIHPGEFEGEDTQNIGQRTLENFDLFRFYQYGQDLEKSILGIGNPGTPTFSAKFSIFFTETGELHPTLRVFLNEMNMNEDLVIADFLNHKEGRTNPGKQAGEVYWSQRTRPLLTPIPRTEGEFITKIIANNLFVGKSLHGEYDLTKSNDRTNYITGSEEDIAGFLNAKSRDLGHSKDYLNQNAYQTLLQEEKRRETGKVRLRTIRLMQYIEHTKAGTKLDDQSQALLNPFIRYFPDEFNEISALVNEGRTPKDIAQLFMEKYPSFFNPNDEIHKKIAQVRALRRYTNEYFTNIRDQVSDRDPALTPPPYKISINAVDRIKEM